ncbi:hypothetical protein LCGC14_0922230 [marine sediment metagenome]|uniref:Uncharacterized protein n=1 Tax=marine sediment metagenome TaxID=412755 RepID=A0A0F9PB28_9ZZZZ
MSAEQLAEQIKLAGRERQAWSEGRLACRQAVTDKINPFFLGSAEHRLWRDGFAHEQAQRRKKQRDFILAPL